MIKCNRCGKMTPAGAFCQSCGTPLAGMSENGSAAKAGYQDQPELPAWLESLRAGERPAPPTNNSVSFSPADLIEEGSLPNWMRAERGDQRDNTSANPATSARPASFSDQVYSGDAAAPTSIPAQSLVDENSLPSWMKEGKQAANNTPVDSEPGNLSAASLVQPDSLPDWMKTLQQPSGIRPGVVPAPVNTNTNSAPQQVTPSAPLASPPVSSLSNGLAARDLIDQESLPSWMQSQNEQSSNTGSMQPAQTGQGVPLVGQTGFSASSLLEVDAIPQWLREGGQNSGQYPKLTANAAPAQNTGWPGMGQAAPAWPAGANTGQPPMQTPPVNAAPPQAGGPFAASSLIDANALPSWLRDQQAGMSAPQPGMTPGGRPAASPIPPRGENIRVPSRPRGEANPTESSELAANVFASMLGVASAVPNYPDAQQEQNSSAAQANAYGQMGQSGQQANAYGQMGQSGQQANAYGQMGQSGQQANAYGQMGQPNLAGQANSYGQPAQSDPSYGYELLAQGNPAYGYGQMGQPDLSGQGNAYEQIGQANGYGLSDQANLNGLPNAGAMPNTPSGMSGVFPQNYGAGNSMSGTYGTNYPGNAQGQMNSALGANASIGGNNSMGNNLSMNGNPTMSGTSPFGGNAMTNASAASSTPDNAGDQKNTRKRNMFDMIREWISR
ncbi:hypothetical protein [Dictyobacter arantiisoli]|uniref:Zinc-ribbon domain-containing protein n=1 Tax=Dictyobacter arantiisoli TaxID=2014874 RepID=A0A5A5TD17_9CHLR|nr:hypothetical protein [Dictyobacter arantiisoli]GCF09352.1 hypothetical protein KDI_29160 [Dictyobacter arantiisoli]